MFSRPLLPEPWLPLNLGDAPKPPEWLVKPYFAREWITLTHGREGSGKSNAYHGLIGAAFNGERWLGEKVNIGRILVVDEENPPGIVNQRLKAMGYVHERDRDRLMYFNQIGCRLGDGDWAQQLLGIADDYKPDLVVIDSMSAATGATNDNESITPLFRTVFKPLAKLGCAVNLIHHDRKMGGSVRDRVSGGAQWLAQVDRQVCFEKAGPMREGIDDDGVCRRGFPIKILADGKARQGSPIPLTHLMIQSKSAPYEPDVLTWMRLVLDRDA